MGQGSSAARRSGDSANYGFSGWGVTQLSSLCFGRAGNLENKSRPMTFGAPCVEGKRGKPD